MNLKRNQLKEIIQSHISSSEYPHLVGWVILTASRSLLEAVIVRIHAQLITLKTFPPTPLSVCWGSSSLCPPPL